MPELDFPLEDLRNYQGISPKPKDFDSYWDESIGELKKLGTGYSMVPAEFKAPGIEAYDLRFSGVGSAEVYAKYLRPTGGPSKAPAILQFHGYTMDSGDWSGKLGYAYAGFHVFAMDCRGQGGKSIDSGGVVGNTHHGHIIRGLDGEPGDLLYRKIFLDTAQLAYIAMAMDGVDPSRIGVMGASQGGALTLACASLVPEIRLAAPVYPFLSDYRRVWEMDMAERAYKELKEYFRHFDPTHAREEEVFQRLGYIDIQNLAPRIQAKVLWGIGLMDDICPPSTQFAAYNKISSEKEMVIYPDFNHERLPGFEDRNFMFMAELLE